MKGAITLDQIKNKVSFFSKESNQDIAKFLEAYDKSYIDGMDISRLVEADGFHPSSLGLKQGKCARRDTYLLRGTIKIPNFNPQLIRIFAAGHALHDRVQNQVAKMGWAFNKSPEEIFYSQAELEIKWDDPPIRGHADMVLVLPWNGRKILVEIKSIGEVGFNNRILYNKAKPDHIAQANIYAYILGLDTIWIFYESKNTQETKIFEYALDKEAAEKQIAKWAKTYELFKAGTLPKRPYKRESEACQACDMHKFCWGDPE